MFLYSVFDFLLFFFVPGTGRRLKKPAEHRNCSISHSDGKSYHPFGVPGVRSPFTYKYGTPSGLLTLPFSLFIFHPPLRIHSLFTPPPPGILEIIPPWPSAYSPFSPCKESVPLPAEHRSCGISLANRKSYHPSGVPGVRSPFTYKYGTPSGLLTLPFSLFIFHQSLRTHPLFTPPPPGILEIITPWPSAYSPFSPCKKDEYRIQTNSWPAEHKKVVRGMPFWVDGLHCQAVRCSDPAEVAGRGEP